MTLPSMTLLYVDNPLNSAAFYQRLLGQTPVELSPGFALFVLNNGFKLGMWAKQGVKPAATLTGGGGELGFLCQDPQEVCVISRSNSCKIKFVLCLILI